MTTDFRQALHELQPANGDYLRIAGNQQLLEFFNAEKRILDESPTLVENLYFSDSVYKVNSRGMWQQRHLVVTNTSLLHFLPDRYRKPRRDIDIKNICAIILCDHADEVLFKIADKNDLRVRLVRRAECAKVVAVCFKHLASTDLAVVTSDLPNLKTLASKKRRFLTKTPSQFGFQSFSYPPPSRTLHIDSDSSHHQDSYSSDDYSAHAPNNKSNCAPRMRPLYSVSDDINDHKQLILLEGWLSHRSNAGIFWKPFFYRIVPPNLQYFDISTKGTMAIEEGLVKQFPRVQYDHTLDEFLSDASKRSLLKGFSRLTNQKESISFCFDVKAFQELPPRSVEAFESAKSITKKYIFTGAGSEVQLWHETRENIIDALTLGQERRRVSSHIFDQALRQVSMRLRTDLLPMLIEEIKRNSAVNQELMPECNNCLKPFSLTRSRKQCGYCNNVFCNQCITQDARFSDATGQTVTEKVCDMCEFHLSPDARSNFAFSYAAKNRAKPLYLSASSPEQMARWVQALNNAAFAYSHQLDPPETRMEGWLKKKSPHFPRWRSRYFVLDGFKLWYFQMSYKGSISINRDSGAHASLNRYKTIRKEDFGGLSTNSEFSFRFELTDSNHIHHLAADTEQQMHMWIKYLKEAARLAEGSTLSSRITSSSTVSALSPTFVPSPTGIAPTGEVTCVFTNIQDSSILWEKEPDGMNIASYYHDKILRDLLQVYKGYEVKTEGDAFMVTFSSASAAISWCIAVQNALLFCAWPDSLVSCHQSAAKEIDKTGRLVFCGLRIQMGVNLGFPICRKNPVTNRMDYFGGVVNRASRIANSAYGGQIICDSSIYNALSSSFPAMFINLGVHRYKGITEPVTVYQISSFELPSRAFPPLKDESVISEPSSVVDRESQYLASPSFSHAGVSDIENEERNPKSNFSCTWPTQT